MGVMLAVQDIEMVGRLLMRDIALTDDGGKTALRSGDGIEKQSRVQRVLVVDDERLVADTVCEILKRFHFDATPCYNGEAAIEAASQACPDFVVSDVMMPKLNGVETALRIQELCPRTRVLLFSGNAATADLLKRARAEGHDFELLAKPIHPEELVRRLQ
ncbi:response regulator receiver protein [Candidatus Koribacter versatilis Ellin345]|uniref:Response regulator receiver protein n=1 Tax=Koribacter versatilis (strain Ellin345) TaxID=204669 RepID=Q1IMK5_KORVE|nr:response regulator [Candidatus Koribacter versatilis]ABF41895.1 response regulator receiver protein [Candidatus Koribacter versatilis Ellin345]